MEMMNSGTLAKQGACALDKYIHKHNHGGAKPPPNGLIKM